MRSIVRSTMLATALLLAATTAAQAQERRQTDFGVDIGVKKSMRDNVVMRIAGIIRTGDSYEDMNGDSQIGIGATFGIGIFWK